MSLLPARPHSRSHHHPANTQQHRPLPPGRRQTVFFSSSSLSGTHQPPVYWLGHPKPIRHHPAKPAPLTLVFCQRRSPIFPLELFFYICGVSFPLADLLRSSVGTDLKKGPDLTTGARSVRGPIGYWLPRLAFRGLTKSWHPCVPAMAIRISLMH